KSTWWHWRWYHWLTLLLIGGTSALLFLPAVRRARESERREQCGRNLNVLANAALEYEIPETATTPQQFWSTKRLVFWAVSLLIILALIGMLLPATRRAREPARLAQCQNNLYQIQMAIENYREQYGQPPPLFTVDEQGRPLHSWRTLLLPFLEHQELFDKVDLTKPWDDPVHNELTRTRVSVFACPSLNLEPGYTNYLANPAGWSNPTANRSSSVQPQSSNAPSTASNTIRVFEVDLSRAVLWMSPNDGDYSELQQKASDAKLPHTRGVHVLTSSGNVEMIDLRPSIYPPTTNPPKNDP
ncbi:MAG: DUF1559 domain-containing protein, partial [Pirellulaceae bacterium]|nr:DUF1559 domain-containing protein [Pirellulaceae bacterium]